MPYLLRICQKQQEKEAERLRKEAEEEKAAREAFELQKRKRRDRCSMMQYDAVCNTMQYHAIPTFKAVVFDKGRVLMRFLRGSSSLFAARPSSRGSVI